MWYVEGFLPPTAHRTISCHSQEHSKLVYSVWRGLNSAYQRIGIHQPTSSHLTLPNVTFDMSSTKWTSSESHTFVTTVPCCKTFLWLARLTSTKPMEQTPLGQQLPYNLLQMNLSRVMMMTARELLWWKMHFIISLKFIFKHYKQPMLLNYYYNFMWILNNLVINQ